MAFRSLIDIFNALGYLDLTPCLSNGPSAARCRSCFVESATGLAGMAEPVPEKDVDSGHNNESAGAKPAMRSL